MSFGTIVELIIPITAALATSSGLVDIIRSWIKKKESSDEEVADSIKHIKIEMKDGKILELNFSTDQEQSILDALKTIEEVQNGKVTESK